MDEMTMTFKGYNVRIERPERPNGKWIWKTEFFHAFDFAEQELFDRGYTRVYFSISNRYGSYDAVRLMHEFHKFIVGELGLCMKTILFGFSRGGLYAFNYALFYPEWVEKVYLDAPVLDMRTWPPRGSKYREDVYAEYGLNEETIETFGGHPVEKLREYFDLGLPTLLVAGDADEVVPFEANSKKMIDYCEENGIPLTYVVKQGCLHHPHSLEDVSPIIKFVEE